MTTTHKASGQGKAKTIAYWISTGLLVAGMLSGGIAQLLRAQSTIDGFQHLGYPVYLTTIIGTWKILGVLTLLLPGFRLLKEWAYAGFFFLMTGAVISHLVSGDGISGVIAQLTFVLLIVLSWALRPVNRKIAATQI
jgi:VIT1/CCC1 family predicted Fe2+/Mn2+ transporter